MAAVGRFDLPGGSGFRRLRALQGRTNENSAENRVSALPNGDPRECRQAGILNLSSEWLPPSRFRLTR